MVVAGLVILSGCTGQPAQPENEASMTGAMMTKSADDGSPAPTSTQGSGASVTHSPTASRTPNTYRSTSLSHDSSASHSTRSSAEATSTIRYQVAGGIAGLQRSLTIEPSGATMCQVNRLTKHGQLPTDQVKEITNALDASGEFTTGTSHPIPSGGRDLQSYRITYRGKTVEVHDTAIPQDLAPAVRLLNDALRTQARSAS